MSHDLDALDICQEYTTTPQEIDQCLTIHLNMMRVASLIS